MIIRTLFWILLTLFALLGMGLASAYLYLNPQIPEIQTFTNINLKAPLKIYSQDQKLIQEYGERLLPITYNKIPKTFINALLDTEDKRFFVHGGIDLVTLANATWQLLINAGEIKTGASTITMQLVKNISGASEIRFIRKFKEMLLAIKLEQALTKQEILTLYLNVIPFGKHAYGIQAAANTYYGKNVDQLSLPQLAMLAGIPKAPEAGNPINGPVRALERRNLILNRMFEQGSINKVSHRRAVQAPITAKVHDRRIDLPALYVAEIVRSEILNRYGRAAYSTGLIVSTTIDSHMQIAAENALIKQLNLYDRRHGYRGAEASGLRGTQAYLTAPLAGFPAAWKTRLNKTNLVGNQHPAIVVKLYQDAIDLLTKDDELITIEWSDMRWARPYINVNARGKQPRTPSDIVQVGDLVRIEPIGQDRWALGQVPSIQGAFIATDPQNGAIRAMVGGYDFRLNQFNHVTQAKRQPGSNFKPFFYAGAMESGLTAATIYNDAPVVLPGGELEETYRPRNSGNSFRGNIRVREALFRSINLVSLRIILDYGPEKIVDYVRRFGFDTTDFPRNVQLAFGGGTIALTPEEVVTGYSILANGGAAVKTHLISSIQSIRNEQIFSAEPKKRCPHPCDYSNPAQQVVEPRVAFIMNNILADTIRKGTGRQVFRELKRSDIMGKTGTTNDADVWFSGYTRNLAATAWAGFSNNSPVGNREWGSTTPIAIWIDFAKQALPSPSASVLQVPDGIVSVRIDPDSGLRTSSTDPDGIFEFFRAEFLPEQQPVKTVKDEKSPYQQIF